MYTNNHTSPCNPVLMSPLSGRPLAAFTLWPVKQPSREHVMERPCVSCNVPLLSLSTHARPYSLTHSSPQACWPSVSRGAGTRRQTGLFSAPLGNEKQRFSAAAGCGGGAADESEELNGLRRDLTSQISPVMLRSPNACNSSELNCQARGIMGQISRSQSQQNPDKRVDRP